MSRPSPSIQRSVTKSGFAPKWKTRVRVRVRVRIQVRVRVRLRA